MQAKQNVVAGAVQSALEPQRVSNAQGKAEASNANAGFSAEGYGKQMASEYLASFGKASVTWQEGVIHLLKTCNDKQQEAAMQAALKVAEASDDEAAAGNLRKRISEARRVFKASRDDYTATLKHMQGKGSWHQKIAKLPKASNKGRKAGNGAGKSTKPAFNAKAVEVEARKVIGKAATPAQVGKVVSLVERIAKAEAKAASERAEAKASEAPKGERIAKQDVGAVVDAVRKMSPADIRKVLDVCLFQLSTNPDKGIMEAAKAAMRAFDAVDNKPQASKEMAA